MDEERARIKELTAQGLPRYYTPCPPYRLQGPRMRLPVADINQPDIIDVDESSSNSTDRLAQELYEGYAHANTREHIEPPLLDVGKRHHRQASDGEVSIPSTTITYPSHGEYPDPDQPDWAKESKAHHAHVLYLDTQQVFADYGTWTCHKCAFPDNLHPWHWCQQCKGARTLDSRPTPGTKRKWGNARATFYNKEAEKLLRLARVAKHRATYPELPSGGDTQAAASMTAPAPVKPPLSCYTRPRQPKRPKLTSRTNPPRTIRQLLGATDNPPGNLTAEHWDEEIPSTPVTLPKAAVTVPRTNLSQSAASHRPPKPVLTITQILKANADQRQDAQVAEVACERPVPSRLDAAERLWGKN